MAGSLQGPAAASLDRTPYGGGKSGGKINRPRQHINSHQDHRPLASSSTTLARKGPYDRPPNGPHSSRGLASRILTGASTFLSSFFRKEPAPSTPLGINDVELVATQVPEEPAFEDLLKERAFSRDQCDRLIKVLQSKMKDNGPLPLPQANGPLSNGLVEDRFPDEELEREQEAREREPERRARETIMDTTDPDSSPVDIARAYMGNRISPVPGAYPVKTLDYGVGRSRDYGVGRSRDDLPRVATPGHTPYVKLRHSRIYDRPTPVTLRTSTVRERKRRVDEDADHNVRRTRMKLSNGPPVSSLPSGSSDYGNGSYLDRMRRLQKKRVERKSEEDVTDLVPMQSTETARRILATLETLTPPKLKTLEEELTLMREKRPTELSPSMLNEQARNTMLTIECPVPEKSIEAFNRPSSTEAPATRVPQPSTDDLKGKGVTPAAEAGPSVVKVPSPSKEKNLRGFRMNTSFEEFNSDDEALPSSSPFTVPQEFTGFASESTTSTVLAPPAPPTAVDHTPVSLPAAVEDNSSKDGKQPETTNIVPESDTKPQPHPVFQFPTSTSATVPLVPVPSSSSAISFQPPPAFSNSFAVPLTAPPVSVSVPTPATSIFQSSSGLTSNGIFGGVTTSAPSTNIDVPVADAEKSVVKDAVDNKVSSESAVDNKDSNLSEPVPPVSVTEEATKPAFTFVSTGPAFATSTSTVSLAGSDAKPVAGGPSSTGGDAGASGAINPLAGIPPFSSSSSLFSTSSSSLPFSSSSSASTVFAFTTPSSSPFTFGAVTTSSASTPNAGSAIFGNPFSSAAGGSSSSPASGGDMDMADEPAQTSTPASPLFASSQPFVFSSPSPAPAPATPAPSPFGTQQTPVFAFGTPPATTSTSPFPAPSVFGIGSSSSFGGTSAPAFGTSTSFGGASSASFGGSSTPAFGTSAPAFGAGSSVPAFGAGSSVPAFGAGSSAPAFGAGSSAPAFGAPTGFGGSSAPAFGASTGFGGASAPAAFGASPGFGGTSAPAFGTSTSFGVASAPSFGAAPVFSSMPSAPAFGGGPSAPAFGAQPFGVQPAVGSQPAGSFGQFQVGQFQIGEKTEKERRTFRYKRTGTTRRPK